MDGSLLFIFLDDVTSQPWFWDNSKQPDNNYIDSEYLWDNSEYFDIFSEGDFSEGTHLSVFSDVREWALCVASLPFEEGGGWWWWGEGEGGGGGEVRLTGGGERGGECWVEKNRSWWGLVVVMFLTAIFPFLLVIAGLFTRENFWLWWKRALLGKCWRGEGLPPVVLNGSVGNRGEPQMMTRGSWMVWG